MVGKRDKPEEIVSKLRQIEVLQGQGRPIADAVRQIGVTCPASSTILKPLKESYAFHHTDAQYKHIATCLKRS